MKDKKKNKKEEIEILSQPFLTDEGFVNPACMNELENHINNMPKTYERFSDDSEWTEKRWIFEEEIVGALANWAIRQSPYIIPDDLETVLKYTHHCLLIELSKLPQEDKMSDGYRLMVKISLCDINKLLWDILDDFRPFLKWNESKNKTNSIQFSSRYYTEENPDNDFIDLDALLHNVCVSIRDETRAFDKFNKEFEKEWNDTEKIND